MSRSQPPPQHVVDARRWRVGTAIAIGSIASPIVISMVSSKPEPIKVYVQGPPTAEAQRSRDTGSIGPRPGREGIETAQVPAPIQSAPPGVRSVERPASPEPTSAVATSVTTDADVPRIKTQPEAIQPSPTPAPSVALAPEIGIADIICSRRTIQLDTTVPARAGRLFSVLDGPHSVAVLACDPASGRFVVKNEAPHDLATSEGAASPYGLSFGFVVSTGEGSSRYDRICHIGASHIVSRTFEAKMHCEVNGFGTTWAVNVEI